MAQAGSNDVKNGVRKSRWTVPLEKQLGENVLGVLHSNILKIWSSVRGLPKTKKQILNFRIDIIANMKKLEKLFQPVRKGLTTYCMYVCSEGMSLTWKLTQFYFIPLQTQAMFTFPQNLTLTILA